MKDVKELMVMERMIFDVDIIPFRQLVTASNLPKFTNLFLFKNTELVEEPNIHVLESVKMTLGEFKLDDKIFPIDQLIIDRRAIAFVLQADSDAANKLYLSIADLLREIGHNKEFTAENYLLRTTTTNCVATLEVDYRDIFSKTFLSFVKKEATNTMASAVENKAKIKILPKSLAFNVNYSVTDKSLIDSNIIITAKQFIIEPRVGTKIEDKIYYTSSPTDSKTHLKLIEDFESLFK